MDSEHFNNITPPAFDGENYHIWAARMEAYLEANDLWEPVEKDYELPHLANNPTMAQLRYHKERKTKKPKARATLFAAVSSDIFTRIMTMKTSLEIWNFLKSEYEEDERIKGMQVLNLVREFEMQRMRESETIKVYSDRLLEIANKVKLLGTDFPDSRIIQKILVTLPEKFEVTISSLENSKDMSKITLAELLNALKAQEQRRLMRQEGSVEGAYQAKSFNKYGGKNRNWQNTTNNSGGFASNQNDNTQVFPPCSYCKKTNHLPNRCWWRPDVKCYKCGQLGHMERIWKSQQEEAKAAENLYHEEQLFVASCFSAHISTTSWLIDSGCTNHMTYDRELFRDLDETVVSKVRVGNGAYIAVKGKGTVKIQCHTGLKLISDVLYVPEINQNLLSVFQLTEKGYKVLFDDNHCIIKNARGADIFKVQIKGKSFALDFTKEEHTVVHKEKNDDVDDNFVKGTWPLSEIGQNCNVALMESTRYKATATDQKCIATIKEEQKMIKKNHTFFLGSDVQENNNEMSICRKKYVKETLDKYNKDGCKTTATLMNNKARFCEKDDVPKVDKGPYKSLIGEPVFYDKIMQLQSQGGVLIDMTLEAENQELNL